MKILVPVKRVPDPTQKAKIKDGHIDLTGASWIVNTFDEYAVETALRLLENGDTNTRSGGEIVVVSIGPDDAAKEIRTCLAMGADRAIHVVANDSEIDSLTVVNVLRAIIETEKPDLVVMGKQAVDGDSNQVGQRLAELLDWPMATFAATIVEEGAALVVGREVDGGVAKLKVGLPALVTVDLRIVAPTSVYSSKTDRAFKYNDGVRFAPLPAIMAAKKKPLDVKPLAELIGSAALTTRYVGFERPAARSAGIKVKDVSELVDKLRNVSKVI
jgi:electron transfer flavoprotein beta subunit